MAQTSKVFKITITTIRKWEKHESKRPFRKIAAEFQCWPNAIRKALKRLKIKDYVLQGTKSRENKRISEANRKHS